MLGITVSTQEGGTDGGEVPADGSRGLVLLVDDEPTIVRGFARILTSAGFSVQIAHDGREAADLARGMSFDAIVSDIAMPEMNGLQLLRSVREHDLDVPVILMTGGPAVESAVQAMEYGALRYLIKPVESKQLEEVVGARDAAPSDGQDQARGAGAVSPRGQAPRRPRRPRGRASPTRSRRCGSPSSRSSRGATSRSSPTRRWCATRSRRCAPRRISSRRPSAWAGCASWARSSAIAWRRR